MCRNAAHGDGGFFEWFYIFKHFELSHLKYKKLKEEDRQNSHGPLTRELTAAWAEFAGGKEDLKRRSDREALLAIGKFIDMYGPEGAKEKRRPGKGRMTDREKEVVEEKKSTKNINVAWSYDISPDDVLDMVRLYRKDPEFQWYPVAACETCVENNA